MSFDPGEVVQLKSGGPIMTVERSERDEKSGTVTVFCVWFEKVGNRQNLQKADFNSVLLQKYDAGAAFGIMQI